MPRAVLVPVPPRTQSEDDLFQANMRQMALLKKFTLFLEMLFEPRTDDERITAVSAMLEQPGMEHELQRAYSMCGQQWPMTTRLTRANHGAVLLAMAKFSMRSVVDQAKARSDAEGTDFKWTLQSRISQFSAAASEQIGRMVEFGMEYVPDDDAWVPNVYDGELIRDEDVVNPHLIVVVDNGEMVTSVTTWIAQGPDPRANMWDKIDQQLTPVTGDDRVANMVSINSRASAQLAHGCEHAPRGSAKIIIAAMLEWATTQEATVIRVLTPLYAMQSILVSVGFVGRPKFDYVLRL